MATLTTPKLTWDQTTQWASEPEIGSIYTQAIKVEIYDRIYNVEFHVGDGRTLGLLFCTVSSDDWYTLHYCFGQFHRNEHAKKFAQFALEHFAETENWGIVPSFQPIDWIDGEPNTLGGDEIVSELLD